MGVKKGKGLFFFVFLLFLSNTISRSWEQKFISFNQSCTFPFAYVLGLKSKEKKNNRVNRGSPVIDVTCKMLFCVQAEFLSFKLD
ncbi:hypothetical protein BCV71DRAFT_30072 [Rhizopus microsporus]|uniref:Secreted protein n=1 Tax=Rhizopus microsporus TaxID=58291 RepID=A0A1X0RUE6_RHIZD|nr:hypothetical protein BCV71DRAFT_30072 [Rhizopus microsporus]